MFDGSLFLQNANVITMDPARPRTEALVVKEGRITAVGGLDEVKRHAVGIEAIDLGGKTVLPGFIDTHAHFLWTAHGMATMNLRGAGSVQEICDAIRGAAADTPPGGLVYGKGVLSRLSEELYAVPVRKLLDEAAPEHRVFILSASGHFSLFNSRAFDSSGLPADAVGVRTDADGEPSGILVGEAHEYAYKKMEQELAASVDFREVVENAAKVAVSVGLTTIHTLEGGPEEEHDMILKFLDMAPSLPLRFLLWYQTTNVPTVLELGLPRIGGCILLDGDFAPRTASLLEPYTDGSGSGTLYYSQEEIEAFVLEAHRAGLQIAMHAVGDGAVEQALRAYGRALEAHPRPDHRHRVEHAELITDDQIERAKRLGVALAIQPPFNHFSPQENYYGYLGVERARTVDPVRRLVDSGVLVAGGSDSSVTPLWPLLCVHSAVNHSNPAERIDVERALALVTTNAARIGFEENDKGSLEPGKLGDMVVLAEDPFEVEPGRIKDIGVEMTVVGGDVVYRARA